ncbi:MAG: hypothetical protein AAFQ07_01445 [Chloroflexota bacterium]
MILKKILFSVVVLLSFVGSVFAAPGPNGTLTGQSNCTSVDAIWSITVTYPNLDWTLSLNSPSLGTITRDIPDSGSGTETFNVVPASGEVVTLSLIERNSVVRTVSFTHVCNVSTEQETVVSEPSTIGDGRLEPFSSDHVIYPLSDQGIVVYNDMGVSVLLVSLDTIEIRDIPATGSILLGATADNYVQIYRLSDGRFQAEIGPDEEGKVHVVFWEGLGNSYSRISTTTYTSD